MADTNSPVVYLGKYAQHPQERQTPTVESQTTEHQTVAVVPFRWNAAPPVRPSTDWVRT